MYHSRAVFSNIFGLRHPVTLKKIGGTLTRLKWQFGAPLIKKVVNSIFEGTLAGNHCSRGGFATVSPNDTGEGRGSNEVSRDICLDIFRIKFTLLKAFLVKWKMSGHTKAGWWWPGVTFLKKCAEYRPLHNLGLSIEFILLLGLIFIH